MWRTGIGTLVVTVVTVVWFDAIRYLDVEDFTIGTLLQFNLSSIGTQVVIATARFVWVLLISNALSNDLTGFWTLCDSFRGASSKRRAFRLTVSLVEMGTIQGNVVEQGSSRTVDLCPRSLHAPVVFTAFFRIGNFGVRSTELRFVACVDWLRVSAGHQSDYTQKR